MLSYWMIQDTKGFASRSYERNMIIMKCMAIHKNQVGHIIWAKIDELAHVHKLRLVCIWLNHDEL